LRLSGSALAALRQHAGRAGRDPEKLGGQVAGLLAVAREHDVPFREGEAADDAFCAEGARVVAALQKATAARRNRSEYLPAEHDRLDELDGQAWELLKKWSIAGKAAHAASGDRARVAEYNLDIIYGRPIRRRRRPAAAPPPGSEPTTPA